MIPKNAKRISLRPLALGEKTGHHHSLAVLDDTRNINDLAEMYTSEEDEKVRIYLRVIEDEAVALVHQEHKTHAIPLDSKGAFIRQGDVMLQPLGADGEYEVKIQTEVTDWGTKHVED